MIKQSPINSNINRYPARKNTRLSTFDYSSGGHYFITICTHERTCFFGEVIDGEMLLNSCGEMVASMWAEIPRRFNQAHLDAYIVMPNHIHGIIVLEEGLSLSSVIQTFKSVCTNGYIRGVHNQEWKKFYQALWQRSFYDHVIRNQKDLLRIQEYIVNNPLQWSMDDENPNREDNVKSRADTRSAPTNVLH